MNKIVKNSEYYMKLISESDRFNHRIGKEVLNNFKSVDERVNSKMFRVWRKSQKRMERRLQKFDTAFIAEGIEIEAFKPLFG